MENNYSLRLATFGEAFEIWSIMNTCYQALVHKEYFICDDLEYVKDILSGHGFCVVACDMNSVQTRAELILPKGYFVQQTQILRLQGMELLLVLLAFGFILVLLLPDRYEVHERKQRQQTVEQRYIYILQRNGCKLAYHHRDRKFTRFKLTELAFSHQPHDYDYADVQYYCADENYLHEYFLYGGLFADNISSSVRNMRKCAAYY